MIGAWATQLYMRLLLGGSALVGGFVLVERLMPQNRFAIAVGVFAIALASLVGVGKFASP